MGRVVTDLVKKVEPAVPFLLPHPAGEQTSANGCADTDGFCLNPTGNQSSVWVDLTTIYLVRLFELGSN